MITESDLRNAIVECQGQREPNANTCFKLAAYYTILDHMEQPTYSHDARYNSGSEFSDAARAIPLTDLMGVMDELMETVRVLAPKLYRATMEKLRQF